MAEIVNRLKEKIRSGGGSTEGIHTIDEAVRALPEGGGGSSSGGSLMLRITERTTDDGTLMVLNASFNDIKNAIENGRMVYLIMEADPIGAPEGTFMNGLFPLETVAYMPPDSYLVRFKALDSELELTSDTPDGELSYLYSK